MSRTPSPFVPIPLSEPPNYSNHTGHFAPLVAPHATFSFVKGFAPNFPLSATAAVPYSAAPSSVATSEIGPSQSSLGRNSQDLQDRESANGAKNNAKWSDDQTLVVVSKTHPFMYHATQAEAVISMSPRRTCLEPKSLVELASMTSQESTLGRYLNR